MMALVLGGARCLEADVAAAEALFTPDIIIACNHAGRDRPAPVDHWVSFHCELFPKWIGERRAMGFEDVPQLWTADYRVAPKGLDFRKVKNWGGSSGLLCVGVALELGAAPIILAGIPMDRGEAHYDDPKPWSDAGNYRRAWIKSRDGQMGGLVRSMSGWTRELLGAPTKEWIEHVRDAHQQGLVGRAGAPGSPPPHPGAVNTERVQRLSARRKV